MSPVDINLPGEQVTSTIATVAVTWDSSALTPSSQPRVPLPDSPEFRHVQGREGDRLIVQLHSEIGAAPKHRAALRTLGLRGIGSASLRRSDDPVVQGNVNLVRHLVGVVILPRMAYKENIKEQIEYIDYGTSTLPGGLARNDHGDYFAYESDRRNILLMWGMDLDFSTSFSLFRETYQDMLISNSHAVVGRSESTVVVPRAPHLSEVQDYLTQADIEVIDGPSDEIMNLAQDRNEDLALARIAFRDIEFSWRAPIKRFHDRDARLAECALYGRVIDLRRARQLFNGTAASDFASSLEMTILKREQGNLKQFKF